jgi:hypothetical protein
MDGSTYSVVQAFATFQSTGKPCAKTEQIDAKCHQRVRNLLLSFIMEKCGELACVGFFAATKGALK